MVLWYFKDMLFGLSLFHGT